MLHQGYLTDMNITDGFIIDYVKLNMIQQSHRCVFTLTISNICHTIII